MPKSATTPPPALPGDIIQITDRESAHYMALMIVENVARRFTAARFAFQRSDRSHDSGMVLDWAYVRLRPDSYARVGTAALVDGEIAKARKLAVETARLIAADEDVK